MNIITIHILFIIGLAILTISEIYNVYKHFSSKNK